jgi:hypothetical protein
MTRRWVLILIAVNLFGLVALAFVYPNFMVSPGPLAPAHEKLATDCFACHAPFQGPSSRRCIACHAIPDIGIRTIKGVAIANKNVKTSFHQQLTEQNCTACHAGHQGSNLPSADHKTFSHALLSPGIRERCETCHAPPVNEVHSNPKLSCGQCHKSDNWKPALFDHALLPKAALDRCETCHKAPVNALHSQMKGGCGQCHSPERWKPATFDHDKFFVLDGNHNTACATCHPKNEFSRYTCYGCHEHQPDRIRAKHLEEGIRNFEKCANCHRSAKGESDEKD